MRWVAVLALVWVGCGDDATDRPTGDGGAVPGIDSGGDPPPDGDGGLPAMAATYTVGVGPLTVEPGVERTECVDVAVGNPTAVMLRSIRTHLSAGSHHMIVYKRTGATPNPVPQPCSAFAHGEADTLFIAQQPEARLDYPAGSGVRLEANDTIGIEIHYINYFSDTVEDIGATIDLDVVPITRGVEDVQFLFTGTLDLRLPPRMSTTVRTFHRVPPEARIFALTSHTHQLGTRSALYRGRSEGDPGAGLLHESLTWSEPPLDTFDPPLELTPGEGLILECTFDNTTDRTVTFGTGFDDEMCFLWVHYL